MPESEIEDRVFMEALVRGESGALEALIDKWERPLFSFVYRYTQNEFTARDLVQETFVRVFTKRDRYRSDYPFASWVFTIAANLCKNRARWARRHPEVSLERAVPSSDGSSGIALLETLSAEAVEPQEKLEHDEELEALKEAVLSLPHDLRTAVLLRHYQEFSYQEIAEVVDCSVRGVETRLYRARKLLKTRMSRALEDEPSAQKKTTSPMAKVVEATELAV